MRKISQYLGKVLIVFSLMLLFPLCIAIIYKEPLKPFLIPFLVSLLVGGLFNLLHRDKNNIYARDGFNIAALSWILMCFIGALPFYINKDASFIDSLFESVSGFTTTGVSIFKDVEILNKSILFWRSFTHFIGGMGILTVAMAIIPLSKRDKSMHLLKAEMPGPTIAKLVPSIKKSLFYLYGIYIFLTLMEFILLLIGGLDPFNSLLISFGTAGTGGFSTLNTSLATYSLFNKYVVAIFMLLFGVNFNIYFLFLIHDFKNIRKNEELKTYIIMYVTAVTLIILNTINLFSNVKEVFIESVFHVSSFMTSTGYSVGNINIYPTSCKIICLLLMLISACAGSTCGGFKISRLIICVKKIKRDLLKLVHPNSVHVITYDGKKLDEEVIRNTTTFLFLYCILIIFIMFIVSFDGHSFEVTLNAVFTTFANVGLAFNISNFADFSVLSKIFLSIGMLFGRLEIYPLIVLFANIKKR